MYSNVWGVSEVLSEARNLDRAMPGLDIFMAHHDYALFKAISPNVLRIKEVCP